MKLLVAKIVLGALRGLSGIIPQNCALAMEKA